MSGLKAQIGWVKESTWGTAVTPTTFLPLLDSSMEKSKPPIVTPGLIGGRRLPTEQQWEAGPEFASGAVVMDLHTHGVEQLLNCAIGTPTKTGAGPYTRAYAPAALEFMTVEIGKPTSISSADKYTYAGCMVPGWSIGVSTGQIARLNLDLVAKSEVNAAGPPTTISLPATMSRFKWDQAAVTFDTVTTYCFGDFTFTANNGLTTDELCLGSSTIAQPAEDAHREYMFEGTLRYPGRGSNTPKAVEGSVISISVVMTAGAHTLTLTMAKALVESASVPISGAGRVQQSVSARILGATASDGAGFTATLVNGTA
jgi:hypothetical protein